MELEEKRGRNSKEEKREMVGDMGKKTFQFLPSPSSHYKDVVSQSNSRWGARIYEQKRPWLGSFQSSEEAASSYNCAAIDFHGGNSTSNFHKIELMDLSGNDEDIMGEGIGSSGANVDIEREHMFDKVVTPSDVGKLNRLVIPKQHAERYFPLDSSVNEKGLLLNFEDGNGKSWRFRYSYWNSSQSYVMTKGWSRFVKEKQLDAGDIVSFQRGVGESDKDRLYIDWKRRGHVSPEAPLLPFHHPLHQAFPWGRRLLMPTAASFSTPLRSPMNIEQLNLGRRSYNVLNSSGVLYLGSAGPQEDGGGDRNEVLPMVLSSVPVVHGKEASSKRLRLFGVNLECPTDGDMLSSSSTVSQMLPSSIPPQTPSLPSLQLRLFNGTPLPRKGKPSLSLDLDI